MTKKQLKVYVIILEKYKNLGDSSEIYLLLRKCRLLLLLIIYAT